MAQKKVQVAMRAKALDLHLASKLLARLHRNKRGDLVREQEIMVPINASFTDGAFETLKRLLGGEWSVSRETIDGDKTFLRIS